MLEQPDEIYVFIVRGTPGAIEAARALAARTNQAAVTRDLPLIDGAAVPLRVKDAQFLSARQDIQQVWYVNPLVVDLYVNIIKSIDYSMRSTPRPSVINLSLGPPADAMPIVGHDEEPMNLATRRAAEKGLLSVFAIGNYFDGQNPGVVNPWCRPDWVVCVGAATADAKEVWSGSARGAVSDPRTWPDVVANGVDVIGPYRTNMEKSESRKKRDESNAQFLATVPPEKYHLYTLETGTSQAAAQVSRAAGQITYFIQEAFRRAKVMSDQDLLFAIEIPRQQFESASAASRAGSRLAGEVSGQTAESVEVSYRAGERWKLVKQLLLDTALPVAGHTPQEAGVGFVSPEYVEVQFGQFGRAAKKIMPIKAVP